MSLSICKKLKLLAILVVALNLFVRAPQPVVKIDLNKETGSMDAIYAWFDYDEPNYTYMKDGKKLLSEIAALNPAPVHVRAPNSLTTCDGTSIKTNCSTGKSGPVTTNSKPERKNKERIITNECAVTTTRNCFL
jgi:hypothetical protein